MFGLVYVDRQFWVEGLKLMKMYENVTPCRGRQTEVSAAGRARERARIIAQMEAEDEAEELAARK